MPQVGIRAFKAELSRYLREVRAGKSLYLTDRGHVVAEVTAPIVRPGGGKAKDPIASDLRWRALVHRGVLRPAARVERTWTKGRLARLPPGTAQRLLAADRGD